MTAHDPAATPADPAPATNPDTLRDRIADALLTTRRTDYADLGVKANHRQHRFDARCALCTYDVDALADAVLAVLPAPTDQAAEEHRLALSEALGLGTGAPWDAIHDRATELGLPPLDRDPVARRLGLLPATVDRAAVRAEIDWIIEHCPEHGCVEPETEVCHCEIAERLRHLAGEAQQDEARAVRCPHGCDTAHCPCLACEADDEAREAQQDPTQDGTEAHPPLHAWRVETRDPLANEWAPGSHFPRRQAAVERYETANRTAPLWRDGTPVERRIVRETTTYSVEQPAAVPRPGQPEPDQEAQQ
jgi:hypothetical protein